MELALTTVVVIRLRWSDWLQNWHTISLSQLLSESIMKCLPWKTRP